MQHTIIFQLLAKRQAITFEDPFDNLACGILKLYATPLEEHKLQSKICGKV
jgi:hypothetical protein